MTTPNLARKTSNRGPRTYAWPPRPPYEFEVLSVTAAINGGIAKPFLTNWAAKLVAETAVDDIDLVTAMLAKEGGERMAIDHLKGAPYRARQAAADRGTLVHAAIESYLAGKKIDHDELKVQLKEERVAPKLWAQTLAMIDGLVDFLFDEEPEIIWSEATLFNREFGYAGTADLIARMRVGGTVVPVVIDVKTSKRVYDETALQLCAYARADFVGLDDGTEMPIIRGGGVPEYGVVVRPKPTGGYEKVVFTLTDDVFDLFVAALAVTRLQNEGVLDGARRPS